MRGWVSIAGILHCFFRRVVSDCAMQTPGKRRPLYRQFPFGLADGLPGVKEVDAFGFESTRSASVLS